MSGQPQLTSLIFGASMNSFAHNCFEMRWRPWLITPPAWMSSFSTAPCFWR